MTLLTVELLVDEIHHLQLAFIVGIMMQHQAPQKDQSLSSVDYKLLGQAVRILARDAVGFSMTGLAHALLMGLHHLCISDTAAWSSPAGPMGAVRRSLHQSLVQSLQRQIRILHSIS